MSDHGQPDSPLPAYVPMGGDQFGTPAQPAQQPAQAGPAAQPSQWVQQPAQWAQPGQWAQSGQPGSGPAPWGQPPGAYPPYYGGGAPIAPRPSRWPALAAIVVFVVVVAVGAVFVVAHLNSNRAGVPNQAALAAMNIKTTDLPGWAVGPNTADDGDSDTDNDSVQLACPQLGPDPVETSEADSPKFSLDETTVSSSTSTYASNAVVTADIGRLSNPAVTSCLKQIIADGFSKQASTSKVSATEQNVTVTPAPSGSPSGLVATIEFTANLSVNGASASYEFDEIVIAHGRVEAAIEITQVGSSVPTDLKNSLAKDVAGRVTGKH
jgi:hypothetical protein